MAQHFLRDLENLQRNVIAMGVSVDGLVNQAVHALAQRDEGLARAVLAGDGDIDEQENRIEQQCLTLLALHQPVAADLRRVVMMLRINADLERMADLAGEVAEAALVLACRPALAVPERLGQLADLVTTMVWYALDAFFSNDKRSAATACRMQDGAEALFGDVVRDLQDTIRGAPSQVDAGLALFTVCRSLQNIAALAADIGADVIFLLAGQQVRHHFEAVEAVAPAEVPAPPAACEQVPVAPQPR